MESVLDYGNKLARNIELPEASKWEYFVRNAFLSLGREGVLDSQFCIFCPVYVTIVDISLKLHNQIKFSYLSGIF